jgi:hypothetical protein
MEKLSMEEYVNPFSKVEEEVKKKRRTKVNKG